jgi:hypothetical protein
MKKFLFIFTIFCFFSVKSNAQTPFFNYTNFDLEVICFADLTKMEIKKIFIEKDSIKYTVRSNDITTKTAFSDINYLKAREGTYAGRGALIGAVLAGSLILTEANKVSSSNGALVYKPNAVGIYSGIAAGSMLLGALIGHGSPKWKIYYIGNQKLSTINIKPTLQFTNASLGLNVKCSF